MVHPVTKQAPSSSTTVFLRSASRKRPLMLLLEDLHWADKPSVLLLEFLHEAWQNAYDMA